MVITKGHIKNAYTYEEYRQMCNDLVAQHKTTGSNQSEKYLEYSRLNLHRMDRLDKKAAEIGEELKNSLAKINKPMVWVVLTELWCGDAAQNIPVLAKIAALSKNKIRLVLLLRDENLEVMDAYLTGYSRSIPKLIALDAATLEELFTWGPRPQPAQQILLDYRAAGEPKDVDYKKDIQLWYLKDNGITLQNEFKELLKKFITV